MRTPRRARSMPVEKSPIDHLKAALGSRHAALLEALPLDKIEYVEHEDSKFHNCVDHRIRLGTINHSDTRYLLWAYMGKEARKDGMPEIHIYAFHPTNGSSTIRSASTAIENGEIREEFASALQERGSFAVMLKASFILKGAALPSDATFTDSLLRKLRRLCRRYKQQTTSHLDETSSSGCQASEANCSSPVPPINLKMCMRKTQQRGPSIQLYDALGPTFPDTPSSLEKAVGDCASLFGLRNTFEEPVADDDGIEWDHLLSTPTTKTKTGGPCMSKLSGRKALNMKHSSTSDIDTPNLLQNRSLGSYVPQTTLDSPLSTPDINSTMAPRRRRPTPTAPASMRSVDEYLALQSESEDLNTELDTIEDEIKATTSSYLKRRSEMCHYIDKELPHIHGKAMATAIAELKSRQSQEVLELKAKYGALKKKQENEINVLKQRLEGRIARKTALRSELAERFKGISKADLLDKLIANKSASKKRKRRDSTDSVQ